MNSLSPSCAALVMAGLTLALGTAPARAQPQPRSSRDIARIAENAYVFGYPLVLMDVTRQSFRQAGAKPNEFSHASGLATAQDRTVVRPNVDTLYSSAWLDLSTGPVVLRVPATDRYYVMQMLDAYSNVFAAPGPRTTGTGAQDFVIVGPNHEPKLAAKMKRIDAPTNMVWIIGRLQVNGEGDLAAASKEQLQFSLRALGEAEPAPQKSVPSLTGGAHDQSLPPEQVARMNAQQYFDKLASLMEHNPPADADAPLVAKFAAVGVEPGHTFMPEPRHESAIEAAVPRARQHIVEQVRELGNARDGWRILIERIGSYGTDYGRRAAVALSALGANLPADAVYPSTDVDAEGKPLTGRKKYVLHFERRALPPVEAFWSLTMYDDKGYLVSNAIDRYALGDRDRLLYNRDGSLDILIQHEAPGAEKRSNWLPAPDGPFTLTMRLYRPKPEVLSGRWAPPPVRPIAPKPQPAATR